MLLSIRQRLDIHHVNLAPSTWNSCLRRAGKFYDDTRISKVGVPFMPGRFDFPALVLDLRLWSRAAFHSDDRRVFTGLGPDS